MPSTRPLARPGRVLQRRLKMLMARAVRDGATAREIFDLSMFINRRPLPAPWDARGGCAPRSVGRSDGWAYENALGSGTRALEDSR